MNANKTPAAKIWPAVISLTACAAFATLAVSWVADMNRDRISANQLKWETQSIAEVLPEGSFDNEPWLDSIQLTNEDLLGAQQPMSAYRARKMGVITAVAITAQAPDGYVGPIKLLIGISSDDSLLAVRAIEHRETPGLGDKIEASKSDWIRGFSTEVEIDTITGATVTSRAVINAVRNALEFYRQNRDAIYTSSPGTSLSEPKK